jgi:hypothetical protein
VIAPLVTRLKTERRIVFVAGEDVRRTSSPPPMIQIDDSSLYANSIPAPGGLPQDDDLFPPPNMPKTKLDP